MGVTVTSSGRINIICPLFIFPVCNFHILIITCEINTDFNVGVSTSKKPPSVFVLQDPLIKEAGPICGEIQKKELEIFSSYFDLR